MKRFCAFFFIFVLLMITIPVASASQTPSDFQSGSGFPAVRLSIPQTELTAGEPVDIDVSAESAGKYTLLLTCRTDLLTHDIPVLSVEINGQTPVGADAVKLPLLWRDDERGRKDGKGNELIPNQVRADADMVVRLTNFADLTGKSLIFELNKGINTVRFTLSEGGGVTLIGLCFEDERGAAAYSDVVTQKPSTGDYVEYYEAENTLLKSDETIIPIHDPTSPITLPYDSRVKLLNTIGGSKWQQMGQFLEWAIHIPKDGWYCLNFKYRQNVNVGMTSYRRVMIDGVTPYKEWENAAFEYSAGWKNLTLGGKNPQSVYLKEGTHTLRLEVTVGAYIDILSELESAIRNLNEDYRQIVMLTGASPDPYRNYHIDRALPDVLDDFRIQLDVLNGINMRLREMTGDSDATKNLRTISAQLEGFLADTDTISKRLTQFKSNVSALSAWMMSASNQPLELDNFAVTAPGALVKKASPGLWRSMVHQVNLFLRTFIDDYRGNDTGETITVWVQSGADQYNVISEIVQNGFTPQTGIRVNLKLVSGQLLMAVVSGRGPDLALQADSGDVMNYAFRDAAVRLDVLDDFAGIASQFRQSALTPLTYESKTYGLPETQTFPMMFYRTDVLAELGLSPPDNWTEALALAAQLQKKNLEFGLPVDFQMFLYQNGGTLYNTQGTATALSEKSAITSFARFCEFFQSYGLPLAFDAQNRLRTGEMPVLISDFTLYNSLSVSAPEIRGLWAMVPVPGTVNGSDIDRSVVSSVGASVMFENGNKEDCWEFMKWWSSPEVQRGYGQRLETVLGRSGRYAPANIEAFRSLRWEKEQIAGIEAQAVFAKGIPAIPGGYFTGRYIENAFRGVLYKGDVPGDAIINCAKLIDDEIAYQRKELGFDR